jgi:hypothetical protein
MAIINYRQINDVLLQCEIDLKSLYSDNEIKGFWEKFQEFKKSHDSHNNIFQFAGQKLFYKSEQLIPIIYDSRPLLLMVFGNPASHSIKSGMFFSHEGDKREHRFWTQILRDSGIGDLSADPNIKADYINNWRKDQLLNLKYNSFFRIGLTVLLTFPSPSSGKWSGVAGVKKLFGAKAFEKLMKKESERVKRLSHEVVDKNGAVITFQKDAWFQLSDDKNVEKYLARSKNSEMISTIDRKILIHGLPPTRNPVICRRVLKRFADNISVSELRSYNQSDIKKFRIIGSRTTSPMFCIERISGDFILSRFKEKESFCLEKHFERRLFFTDEDWLKFVTVCNQVNIWSWKKRYDHPDIVDGWSWEVEFEIGKYKIDSSGSNAGPKDLDQFMQYVVELLKIS